MFWDCSWVQNNNVNGKNYGTYAFELLQGITIPPSQVPTKPTTSGGGQRSPQLLVVVVVVIMIMISALSGL